MDLSRFGAAVAVSALLIFVGLGTVAAQSGSFALPLITNSSNGRLAAIGGLSRFLNKRVLDSQGIVPGSALEWNWPTLLQPIGLEITGRTKGFVGLDWADVPAATSYQVFFQHTQAADSTWKLLPFENIEVSLDGSSAIVSGFADNPHLVRSFSIRAVNDVGISDLSDSVKAPPGLEAPTNLSGSFQEPSGASLNWHVVPNAESYQVGLLQSVNSVPQWVILPYDNIGVSIDGSEAVGNPLPEDSGLEYHFAVRAVNNLGESDWSEILLIQFEALSFSAVISASLNNLETVVLDWQEVPNADSYLVRFWQLNQWVNLPIGSIQVAIDGTKAVVSQLPSYLKYRFQVRAVDEDGNFTSDWSDRVQVLNVANTPVATAPISAAALVPLTATPTPTPQQITIPPTPTPRAGSATGSFSQRSSSNGNSSRSTATPIPEAPPTILAVEWEDVGEKIRVTWNSVPGPTSFNPNFRCADPDPNASPQWNWLEFYRETESDRGSLDYDEEGILECFLWDLQDIPATVNSCDGGQGLEFSVTSVFGAYILNINRSEWVGVSEPEETTEPEETIEPTLEPPSRLLSTWVEESGHWLVLWWTPDPIPDSHEIEFFCRIGEEVSSAEDEDTLKVLNSPRQTGGLVSNLKECDGVLFFKARFIKGDVVTEWVESEAMVK